MELMILHGYNINSDRFLFVTKNNTLYFTLLVNHWLKSWYKKTPMDLHITPHGFRHTHCSLLFESGAWIKEVQKRLGHKDINTTMNIWPRIATIYQENWWEICFLYRNLNWNVSKAVKDKIKSRNIALTTFWAFYYY